MDASIEGLIDFRIRTRVVQGAGSLDRLGVLAAELGCRRALVVTDPGIRAAGHVARALESLVRNHVESLVFDGACENPTTETVDQALAAAVPFRPDLIIGLGGGSSLDTAKGCNFLLAGGGRMQDYWGTGKGRGSFLPMIAVPTTGGTGSEMQSYALISDAETHVKMACGDPRAAFAIALLDPALTTTQPAGVTAVTGMDAISHAVETWVCRKRNQVSMMFSREAFRLLAGAYPRVLDNPLELAARADMQWGAALAGLAIENSMLGAAHALANPLTAHWGTIHGVAVGITLPRVVRFNGQQPELDSLYGQLLATLPGSVDRDDDRPASVRLADLLIGWGRKAGLPTTIEACGGNRNELDAMSREAAAQWTAGFNPRPLGATEARALYEEAF